MNRRIAAWGALILSLGAAGPVSAGWLVLCDERLDSGHRYLLPDGRQQTLLVADAPLGDCAAVPVNPPAGSARWAALVPDRVAKHSAGGIGLLGVHAGGDLRISETIASMASAPAPQPADGATANPPSRDGRRVGHSGRSTWVWEPGRWLRDPQGLLADLVAADMATVFIAVPITGQPLRVTNPDGLAGFIRRADAAGIEAWAVEGDPGAVTVSGRENFVARSRALASFNAAQAPRARLNGVQYDIEPYLLPGFDLEREGWLTAYVSVLRELRRTVPMPIEAAVPFWWSKLTVDGKSILAAMTDVVDGVTVMNYRTDPAQIYSNSIPYLEWGQRDGRHVRIALEAGPLDDQTLWNYRTNDSGRLWQIDVGDRTALILWEKPAPNPRGRTFALTHEVAVPASRTTFFGRRERLNDELPALTRQWTDRPAFIGIALHEYLNN